MKASKQRPEYERQRQERMMRLKKERIDKERQEEEQKIRRLRAERVLKANPVRRCKPLPVLPSYKPGKH